MPSTLCSLTYHYFLTHVECAFEVWFRRSCIFNFLNFSSEKKWRDKAGGIFICCHCFETIITPFLSQRAQYRNFQSLLDGARSITVSRTNSFIRHDNTSRLQPIASAKRQIKLSTKVIQAPPTADYACVPSRKRSINPTANTSISYSRNNS